MSKDKQIEEIKIILMKRIGKRWATRSQEQAEDLYDAGFRDITDLRKWLDKRKGKWDKKDGKIALGHSLEIITILDKLESL
jgi:hypothetical protein